MQRGAGKAPPEALLEDIESLNRQISNNDKFIEGKRIEQEEIKSSHADRYQTLQRAERNRITI